MSSSLSWPVAAARPTLEAIEALRCWTWGSHWGLVGVAGRQSEGTAAV